MQWSLRVESHARPVNPTELLPNATRTANLEQTLTELHACEEYLWVLGTNGAVYSLDTSRSAQTFPSQYFRRRLHAIFGLDKPWDWRTYAEPEPELPCE